MHTIHIVIAKQQSFSLKIKSNQCHIMLQKLLFYCAFGQIKETTSTFIVNKITKKKNNAKFGCLSMLLGVPNADYRLLYKPQFQGFPLVILF